VSSGATFWVFALFLLLLLAGRGLLRLVPAVGRGPAHRAVLSFLGGALAWHLLLQALTLLGVPWSRPLLAASLVLLAGLPHRLAARRPATAPPAPSSRIPWGWGDGAATLAILAFALLAPTLWITTPDFVYHWGLKGEHAFLARGIDSAWLARPWNWSLHPDYPHLLPILYASTALLSGRFDAPSLQLWSALFLGGIVLAARAALGQTLANTGIGRSAVQGGVALVGLAAGAWSIGYLMAGGADGMIALALAAALPTLLAPAGPGGDLEIGLAAGFAAAAKIEGVPLAAILVGIHLLRRLSTGLRPGRAAVSALLALAAPSLAVVVPWFVEARRFHLFQATNSGPFDLARGQVILPAMVDAMNAPELHFLPWAVLLLPLLALIRRTRALAAVASAQLAFYAWAYFASTLEPRLYVLSNFARLLFHLLPAVLVGAVVALAPQDRRRYPPDATQGEGERREETTEEEPRRPVEQVEIPGV
jgi:hypothetical protein